MKHTRTATYGDVTVGVLVDQHGEPWFFAHEIAKAYGSRHTNDVTKYVKDRHKAKVDIRDISTTFIDGNPNDITKGNVDRPNTTIKGNGIGNPIRSVISLKGLFAFMMRASTQRAVQFQDWVTDELLPSIYKGEQVTLAGTPMQDVMDATGAAALVGRIEILESTVGELVAQLKSVSEDRDYWRTIAQGMARTEINVYGDSTLSDLTGM